MAVYPSSGSRDNDWLAGLLNGRLGKDKKPVTPAPPKVPTLEEHIVAQGPQGYDAAIRQNLGLDIQQGGAPQTSGMAGIGENAGTPYWYDPVAATPDPLQQLLGMIAIPQPPVTPPPTTPPPTTPPPTTPPRGGLSIRRPYSYGGGRDG